MSKQSLVKVSSHLQQGKTTCRQARQAVTPLLTQKLYDLRVTSPSLLLHAIDLYQRLCAQATP